MFKRIAIPSLITLSCIALVAGYFFHVGKYAAVRSSSDLCLDVRTIVLDSLESCIANKEEITRQIGSIVKGRAIDSIDTYELERVLCNRGEIMSAQAYHDNANEITVEVTQRKPVIRLDNGTDRFYSDITGYLFPVENHIDVPVITGHLTVNAGTGYKGYADSSSTEWIRGMAVLAERISSDSYWSRQIEQIDIEKNGDIVFYTATGKEKIIFGDYYDIEEKFKKLEAYYTNIEPLDSEKEYKSVNLKFKNQIICK